MATSRGLANPPSGSRCPAARAARQTGDMSGSHDLIDTTEMYLRTIFELEEEGIVPLRARIAQRLGQSGPTVFQTVARMERAGLLTIQGDRQLHLSDEGRQIATRVMRKHRLAECLLVQIVGLQWELVHEEACRWEHVMSDAVERRLLDLLGNPTESPYGNPIPGLDELRDAPADDPAVAGTHLLPLSQVATQATEVTMRRIAEPLQGDNELMSLLYRAGIRPRAVVTVHPAENAGWVLSAGGDAVELSPAQAKHVLVDAPI